MNFLPQWTERNPKRGLDPLGMQYTGVQVYQTLLPGLSNVTLRARYYGLYCWASEIYAMHVGSDDIDAWRNFIRSLEALHALVAVAVGENGGVAGVQWAERTLNQGDGTIDFSEGASIVEGADKYLQQSFGIYGQAYVSQLDTLGLFDNGGGELHDLPMRTALGLSFANAFSASIGADAESLFVTSIMAKRIRREDLVRLAPVLPSNIPEGAETDLIETLLFAQFEDASDDDISRSRSLMLILHTADQLGRIPTSDEVRELLFDGDLKLPNELEVQRLWWETYQTQDMWQVAAATLLEWVSDLVNEFVDGRSLSELETEVTARLLNYWPGQALTSWDEFRSGSPIENKELNAKWHMLLQRRGGVEARSFVAFELMGCLGRRLEAREDLRIRTAEVMDKGGYSRSIWTELTWLESRSGMQISKLLAQYVAQRVAARHVSVATQKLRRQNDYTFLFEPRDGRLTYRARYQPAATSPRLGAAIQFLRDIKLIDQNGLTARGRSMIGPSE